MNRYRVKRELGLWRKGEIVTARPAPFACMRVAGVGWEEVVTNEAFHDLFEAVPKPHFKVGDMVEGASKYGGGKIHGVVRLFMGVMCIDDGACAPWRMSSMKDLRHTNGKVFSK